MEMEKVKLFVKSQNSHMCIHEKDLLRSIYGEMVQTQIVLASNVWK